MKIMDAYSVQLNVLMYVHIVKWLNQANEHMHHLTYFIFCGKNI
jgi:hypothetical protein